MGAVVLMRVAVGVDACVRSHRGPGVLTRLATTDWAVTHLVRQPTSAASANARVASLTLRLCNFSGGWLMQACGTTSRACWRRSCVTGESCPSGKLGVVTFKPHRFCGSGLTVFLSCDAEGGKLAVLVCVVHVGGVGLFALRSG
jgi:hypothetical protein